MLLGMLATTAMLSSQDAIDLRVLDRFGRDVTARGITLLDWEGHLANPAVKLTLKLSKPLDAPAEVYVSGTNSRIHFDRSEADDRAGIGKRMRLREGGETAEFHVAIFPDRDGKDEEHKLMIQMFAKGAERARIKVPVRVIDQDRPDVAPSYPIHLDFSEDRTGFFANSDVRKVIREVAGDWGYFIEDPGYAPVPAGEERIRIWNEDGFRTSRPVTIAHGYSGYTLFVCGIRHDEMRAGGAPSRNGALHRLGGVEQTVRRSGSVEFDVRGNWNLLGWFLTRSDDDWWTSGNQRAEPSDLYSIALHEMGHALCFHSHYPVWGKARDLGRFEEPAILEYHGGPLATDSSDHLPGAIDPVSLYGSFGNEYHGRMKARRWLLTKSHLLALRSIGYRVRGVGALATFSIKQAQLDMRASRGVAMRERIEVLGGVPEFHFSIVTGKLPAGVELESFTGVVSGTPTETGRFEVEIEVRDNDPTSKAATTKISMEVKA